MRFSRFAGLIPALALLAGLGQSDGAHAEETPGAFPLPPIGELLNDAVTEDRLREGDFLAEIHERCAGLELTLLTMHQVTAEANGQAPDPDLMSLQPIMNDTVRRALILRVGNGTTQAIAREITDQQVRKFARYYGGERVEVDGAPVEIAEDQKALQGDLNNCITLHENLKGSFTR